MRVATWNTADNTIPGRHEERDLRLHILPKLGHRPIAAIKRTEIQGWVHDRSKVLSANKVAVLHRWVGSIFKAAVLDEVIRKSPCVDITLPRIVRKRVEPIPTDGVAALANSIAERYRALIVLMAGTGLRQAEAFGVTLDRVDFLRRTLRVDQQVVAGKGRPPQLTSTLKTEASYRTVPLSDVVIKALARHIEKFPPGEDGLIFTNGAGSAIRRNNFGEVWHPARKAAGLADGITSHDLRHYYASLLIQKGASVKTVQARLGHKSAVETLHIYGHLWPDQEEATRLAVDEVLGGAFGGILWDREAVGE